jgi:UDP-N-acetylmuramyl tripeptide synthase
VLVTGTNGKSTVTAMLRAALATRGPVASNADGANTPAGLVATLAGSPAQQVVLETDEGWLPWAVAQLRPVAVVLLNLSRDQLHRHPEVRALAASWRAPLAAVPTVVANADDPAVVWAAGMARAPVWVAAGRPWRDDATVCPACGRLLRWRREHWWCDCGLRRPSPGPADDLVDQLSVHLPGEVNRANARTSLAAATSLGVAPAAAAAALADVHAVAGRYAEVDVAGRRVRLLLAKNPASWQTTLRLCASDPRPVVLAFNADGVDGRDPSWLYDVDFTPLRGRPVVVCGRRAADLHVRLRIDEVPVVGRCSDVRAALALLPPGPVDLVANYTAFQESRRSLHP